MGYDTQTPQSTTTRDGGDVAYIAEALTGVLERVTYHNEENGYTVGRLAIEGARDLVTVVGSFSNPVVGELLVCEGRWTAHREFGRQFQVERYSTSKPATVFAIEKYLGSGLIKGIGPVMAKRMVDLFGLDTLDLIENEPRKLLRVEGIGEKRIEMIRKAWHEQREIRNVMLFLQGHGVSATFAVKIYKTYGDRAIAMVEENPYRLAQDIWGIGFKTADKIAQKMGVAPDSERRLEAGLIYTLSEATEFGHLYLPESKLIQSAAEILGVEPELLPPILEEMIASEAVIGEEIPGVEMAGRVMRALYHPALYYTEVGLAAQIRRRLLTPPGKSLSRDKITAWLRKQEEAQEIALSDEQKEAVALALENRFFILTGGPGTGKTLTTNTIARAFDAQKKRLLLVSPTGRAAKRLSEVTGREAQTIHRMLKFEPGTRSFQFNDTNPLPCDVLIADEVSMLDAVLANNLLKAVPEQAQIVFVGDSDQLPSVGAGNVLGDLLGSGVVPSIRLTQVFRQARESLIVTNAHRIRNGEFPVLATPKEREGKNCLWIEADDIWREPTQEELAEMLRDGKWNPADPTEKRPRIVIRSGTEIGAETVARLVRKTLPALGFRADDIQVLSAMHKGTLGVGYLNELLQETLNPADPRGRRPELLRGSRRFRIGDRVIQLVNNYDKQVYNGDIGKIKDIKPDDQMFLVEFPEGVVEYDYADYDELQLANVISIHKCIKQDQRVWTGSRGLVPIRDLHVGETVFTGLGEYKPVVSKVNTGVKPVVTITTKMGHQVKVSAEHPILVHRGSKAEFVQAQHLRGEDLVCISRHFLDTDRPVELPVLEFRHQGNGSRWREKENGEVRVPSRLDQNLAWLLGALVGDGSYRDQRDGTVDLTNQDEAVLRRVRSILESYHLHVGQYKPPTGNATRLFAISRPFRQWLCRLGLDYCKAHEKCVPPLLFQAPACLRAAFLQGLFDTDGSAGIGRCRACRLSTCSSRLARDVQELMLTLGIVANLDQYTASAYHVSVSGTSLSNFHRHIGFSVDYKQERLERLLMQAVSRCPKTNNDIVPWDSSLVQEVVAAIKEYWRRAHGCDGRLPCTEEDKRIGALLRRLTRQEQHLNYIHLELLRKYMGEHGIPIPGAVRDLEVNRFFYDKIQSVNFTDDADAMYDIEVEGVHSFVSNGFVCHNSQGSEYRAVVLVLHSSQFMMLQRNLLYTGLTRARDLCILVGDKRAVARAVRNDKTTRRFTRLAERLQDTNADMLTPPDRLL